jgi:hypothetical protein
MKHKATYRYTCGLIVVIYWELLSRVIKDCHKQDDICDSEIARRVGYSLFVDVNSKVLINEISLSSDSSRQQQGCLLSDCLVRKIRRVACFLVFVVSKEVSSSYQFNNSHSILDAGFLALRADQGHSCSCKHDEAQSL